MEYVKIFDENYTYIKDESRDNVHLKGLWHETFHCWLIDEEYVYIQKRSTDKKDFPGLFDITAAGHILATETVEDGIREVEEELGLAVDLSRLRSKGAIRDIIELPNFHDYEFANVFLYQSIFVPSDFSLQVEEVASVHRVKKEAFIQLFLQEVEAVICTNIMDEAFTDINLSDFVPHDKTYFEEIARMIELS